MPSASPMDTPYASTEPIGTPSRKPSSEPSASPSCPTGCESSAIWQSAIRDFNINDSISSVVINQLYTYGGDIEFWPIDSLPDACHAPAVQKGCDATSYYGNSYKATAAVYASTPGVKSVSAIIDGLMNGWSIIQEYGGTDPCQFGDFYPNLNNLTQPHIETLAQQTAELYCADNTLDGVQLDLSPHEDVYAFSLEVFVTALGTSLRDAAGTNGCRNDAHPFGRTISFHTVAHRMSPTFYNDSLGENGIYVFSGKDLQPKDGFEYNSVAEFGTKLDQELDHIAAVIGPNGKFSISVPIAATKHEYEQYVPMVGPGCGPACQGYDATAADGITMQLYVEEWLDVLTDAKWGDQFKIKEGGQFLGLSFWVWTDEMAYPPMAWFDNRFYPASPSVQILELLKLRLPELQATTTMKLTGQASVYPEGFELYANSNSAALIARLESQLSKSAVVESVPGHAP